MSSNNPQDAFKEMMQKFLQQKAGAQQAAAPPQQVSRGMVQPRPQGATAGPSIGTSQPPGAMSGGRPVMGSVGTAPQAGQPKPGGSPYQAPATGTPGGKFPQYVGGPQMGGASAATPAPMTASAPQGSGNTNGSGGQHVPMGQPQHAPVGQPQPSQSWPGWTPFAPPPAPQQEDPGGQYPRPSPSPGRGTPQQNAGQGGSPVSMWPTKPAPGPGQVPGQGAPFPHQRFPQQGAGQGGQNPTGNSSGYQQYLAANQPGNGSSAGPGFTPMSQQEWQQNEATNAKTRLGGQMPNAGQGGSI